MSRNFAVPTSSKAAAAARRTISLYRPTILIAEDSADAREMMQLLLETRGYRVVTADDGMHAVAAALTIHPDLVLLDFELPKLDGLSVTRNLRLQPKFKNVPIII